MNTKGIISVPGGATPCVSIIFDGQGDVATSVADVALLETSLNGAKLNKYTREIKDSHSVLIDGDLSQEAIKAVCSIIKTTNHSTKPLLFFEPVSAPKSTRAVPFLSVIDYASPNMAELKAMARAVLQQNSRRSHDMTQSGGTLKYSSSETEKTLQAARPLLQLVLEQGLGNVVLTLGSLGAALCTLSKDKKSIVLHHAPALPATIVNCSGAGDCLVAGFLHGLVDTEDPVHALAIGVAAAKRAVQCDTNVPINLSAAELKADALQILKGQIQVHHLLCACCCDMCCKFDQV